MHKLLIVDDDEILRNAIETNIDWETNGIKVIDSLQNGQDCLNKLKTCTPDVIISDIMMPFVDGLKLAELIYRFYPQIKLVLLTAYDDFQYARKALDFKVSQYVMKYEDTGRILEAVIAACKESDQQKNNSEIVKRSKELLKNEFLSKMILKTESEDKLIEQAELLGIEFPGRKFCEVILSSNSPYDNDIEKKTLEIEIMNQKIKGLLEKVLQNSVISGYCFIYNSMVNICLNFGTNNIVQEDLVAEYISDIANKVSEIAGINITACVGNVYEGINNVSKSYNEALQLMEMRGLSPGGYQNKSNVITMSQVNNQSLSQQTLLLQIIDFIKLNCFQEKFSLNLVSEEVHVSAAYISTLFKKCKGINFNEYITDIRMKKAIELLINTNLKTYDISEKVGYSNSQYFSVLFKRYTGFSPTDYRQRAIREK